MRENIELYPADAATVQVTLTVYFCWEIPVRFTESGWNTSRLKEMVRRTKRVYTRSELLWIKADGEESIEGANWDAQKREKVENGRYKRPIE